MRQCNTFHTFFYFNLDLLSLPRTYTVYLGHYGFHLGQYGFHLGQNGFYIGSMQKSMQLIGQNLSQLSHAKSILDVFMFDRPSFDFGNI